MLRPTKTPFNRILIRWYHFTYFYEFVIDEIKEYLTLIRLEPEQ